MGKFDIIVETYSP